MSHLLLVQHVEVTNQNSTIYVLSIWAIYVLVVIRRHVNGQITGNDYNFMNVIHMYK